MDKNWFQVKKMRFEGISVKQTWFLIGLGVVLGLLNGLVWW